MKSHLFELFYYWKVYKTFFISIGSDPKDSKPKAYGILRSIGRVSADENRKTIASLTEHVNKELGISSDEFRLFFVDLDHDLVEIMGKICTDLGE